MDEEPEQVWHDSDVLSAAHQIFRPASIHGQNYLFTKKWENGSATEDAENNFDASCHW